MKFQLVILSAAVVVFQGGCCSYERGSDYRRHSRHEHGYVGHTPPGSQYPSHNPQPPTYNPPVPPPSQNPQPPTYNPPPSTNPPAAQYPSGGDYQNLELKTEDFSVRKESVPAGVVKVRRYVTRENVSAPVSLCHDEYSVERVPASGVPSSPWGDMEAWYEIRLSKDVATPVVTPRVYEVLKIHKTVVCETNSVTGVVRTEKADVSRQ